MIDIFAITCNDLINCMHTDPFPPPKNVHLTDVKLGMITFSWIPTVLHCSALTYEILSDCGECPTATSSTLATCTFESSLPRQCTNICC